MDIEELPKDRFLVITGACGFIGSAMVRYFNDHHISNLLLVDDFHTSEKWKNIVQKQFVDLISKEDLLSFLHTNATSIAGILHLGACSDTTQIDGDYLLQNNYRYSIALAEFALQYDLPFVYASSAATYGDGSRGFDDDETKLQELAPLNRYGFSKHLFDLWLQKKQVLNRVIGLKYFNVFGPNEYHKKHMASWIYKMMPKAIKEKKVQLFKSYHPDFKDGEQCRDFIYIKDVVKMTADLFCASFEKVSGIFNIGTATPTTWNQLATALFAALDLPVNIEYIDMPDTLTKQYQYYTCANMEKFSAFKKQKPLQTIPIHDAVRDYVRNYLVNEIIW